MLCVLMPPPSMPSTDLEPVLMVMTTTRRSEISAPVANAGGWGERVGARQTEVPRVSARFPTCQFFPRASPTLSFSILAWHVVLGETAPHPRAEIPPAHLRETLGCQRDVAGGHTLIFARFFRGVWATPRMVTMPAALSFVMSDTLIPWREFSKRDQGRKEGPATCVGLQFINRLVSKHLKWAEVSGAAAGRPARSTRITSSPLSDMGE